MRELKKTKEVFRSNIERLEQEISAYKKQNEELVQTIKDTKESQDDELTVELINKKAIKEYELTPDEMWQRISNFKQERLSWTKQDE